VPKEKSLKASSAAVFPVSPQGITSNRNPNSHPSLEFGLTAPKQGKNARRQANFRCP